MKSVHFPNHLTIQGRQGVATIGADPQRSFLWIAMLSDNVIRNVAKYKSPSLKSSPQLQSLQGLVDKIIDMEDFIIKCRSASIPSKAFEEISTYYYGQKRNFPGRISFSNTLDLEYEETERQTIKKFIDNWMLAIYDTNYRDSVTVGNRSFTQSEFIGDITLRFFGYSGVPLDKDVRFYNVWPKDIKEVTINYGSSDLIRYNISFSFDYWQLVSFGT